MTLFKGGGVSLPDQRVLWNLPRESRLARHIGDWFSLGDLIPGRGYFVEQLSFFCSFLPFVVIGKPDVIYFSDKNLGDFLWRWRRWSKQDSRLLFCNGGTYPPPYDRFDVVQQLVPDYLQAATDTGEDPSRQKLLALGFDIPPRFDVPTGPERGALKVRLGLPVDRPVVLSVSAVNASHKRLDYLIRELAALEEPRPFIMLLGEKDAESAVILDFARDLLRRENFAHRTVGPDEVGEYYSAADVAVLASTREGFGRTYVEALAHGLPCLAHDFGVARHVLGEHGYFADFNQQGALTRLLGEVLAEPGTDQSRQVRHQDAFARFAWPSLRASYVDLVRYAAAIALRDRKQVDPR